MRYKTSKALEQAVKAAAVKLGRDTNGAIAGFYHDRFLCRVFSESEAPPRFRGCRSGRGGRGGLDTTCPSRQGDGACLESRKAGLDFSTS